MNEALTQKKGTDDKGEEEDKSELKNEKMEFRKVQ